MDAFADPWHSRVLLRRLVPSLRRRRARLWQQDYGLIRRDAAWFLVDRRNWADRMLIMRGAFERAQLDHLLGGIGERRCQVFLDIGANLGAYAIFVALRTACRRIIAFEPDPRAHAQLRANLLLNGLTGRVEAREAAVSSRTGRVPFVPGSATHSVLSKVGDAGPAGLSVAAVRLDDDFALAGERIAFKIDIEGHELQALEGMTGLLGRNQCFLQVECFARNAAAYVAAIERLGYRLLHRIDDDHYFANF